MIGLNSSNRLPRGAGFYRGSGQADSSAATTVLKIGIAVFVVAEFVYQTGVFPDLEYSFKHALTQDVAYGGLLQDRRRELHARIIEAIETIHHNRLGEHVELLAHHAHRGELREKAVSYLLQAGDKAGRRSARAGTGVGEFIAPHGCVVDTRGDLYVAEVSWTALGKDMTPPRELRSLVSSHRTCQPFAWP